MNAITFVALVSEKYKSVFEANLNASPPVIGANGNELIVISDFSLERPCVSLNHAIDISRNDVIVFVQADVYLPDSWDRKLCEIINGIEEKRSDWGVLGIFGVSKDDEFVGHVYSNGMKKELGKPGAPVEATSLDETLFVLNKKTGVRFDERFPYLMLYGNDLLLQASEKRYENYIISNFFVHNSLTGVRYLKGGNNSVEYFRRKWPEKLPFHTVYLSVYPKKWKNFYYETKVDLLAYFKRGKDIVTVRHENPSSIRSIYS